MKREQVWPPNRLTPFDLLTILCTVSSPVQLMSTSKVWPERFQREVLSNCINVDADCLLLSFDAPESFTLYINSRRRWPVDSIIIRGEFSAACIFVRKIAFARVTMQSCRIHVVDSDFHTLGRDLLAFADHFPGISTPIYLEVCKRFKSSLETPFVLPGSIHILQGKVVLHSACLAGECAASHVSHNFQ